jgi:hypothetical protein
MKILLALWALGTLAGCADPHLGDLYGRRTRTALDAQAQTSGGDSAGRLDADDAKLTLARQRGRAAPGTAGAAQALPSTGAYGYSGTILGGSSAGAVAPSSPSGGQLRMDAVR